MFAMLAAAAAQAATPPAKVWPTREGDVVLKDFRFRDGESLPEVRMHYTTLGSPHRSAPGQVDNAIMVLHGTAGTASSSCGRSSPTSSTARASRSTSANITSSFPTISAMGNP